MRLKFYILSIIIGIMAGIVIVPFRILLSKAFAIREILFSHEIPWWGHLISFLILWGIGTFIYWLVKKFPLIAGSGIPQAEGAIYGRFKFVHAFKSLIAKFVGGILGIGMGYSLGPEGPSAQMGAYCGQLVGKWFKAGDVMQKYLIAGGTGAGLSCVFTAPLASTIFVVEEVVKYDSARITISALLGCVASGWIAQVCIPGNPYALINTEAPDLSIPVMILIFFGISILISLLGRAYNYLTLTMVDKSKKANTPHYIKALAMAVVTYIMGYFFIDVISTGDVYLQIQGVTFQTGILFLGLIILIKLVFTTFCYSAGLPGGIFLPLIVIGGLAGKWYGLVLAQFGIIEPHHFGYFMFIGMAALLTAVIRTPVTALVLILELTGQFSVFFPMIIVVGITYFISEMIGCKPINDCLYQRMLPPGDNDSTNKIIIPFIVSPDSYMDNKNIKDVVLPENCTIISVSRDEYALDLKDVVFRPGDRIEVKLYSKDLEELYGSLRSMTNE